MLNQTFSLANFEEIYDEDNRKGKNQDELFFPEVAASSKRLSAKARAIRAFKKRYSSYKKYPKEVQRRYDVLSRNLKKQKDDREAKISIALAKVAENVSKKSFSIGITKNSSFSKPVYERDNSAESYYALRQIKRNIRHLYKTKPADRNLIVSQIQNLLKDNFPYIIIRADISNFFESVDQQKLIEKLVRDQLLSTSSIKLIKQVLRTYSVLAPSTGVGIPRGLGISSDLAELFLKPLDQGIKEIEGVAYYARYVDDIFILISPSQTVDASTYQPQIQALIEDKSIGLSLNKSKTVLLKRNEHSKKFEYLGYEFFLKKGCAEIDITDSKFKRLENRIYSSFRSYEKQRHCNAKAAYRLILKRVKFLTSNTRLINNKENAFVGAFFGNPHLTNYTKFKKLDGILSGEISKLNSVSLKAKLSSLSFERGHQEKTYAKFNRHRRANKRDEFSRVVEAWKHEK